MATSLHVAVIRSGNHPADVHQRLQSTPLLLGLNRLGVRTSLITPGATVGEDSPTHMVVHFYDRQAVVTAFKLRQRFNFKIVCLCCDIYDLEPLRAIADGADLLLAPTALHRDVLRSAVLKPVKVLPEAVDAIALPGAGPHIPVQGDRKICWFGYPESFAKSMRFVMPHLLQQPDFLVDRFDIITTAGQELCPGVRHRSFVAETFYADTAEYSHSLLNHFAHDLQVNTYIKSPNKLVTSIVRGLVPLASATPAYVQMARRFGLEGLLFGNAGRAAQLIRSLDAERDRAKYGLDEVARTLEAEGSPQAIASRFLELIA